jgi:hypothetical protein
MVKKFWIGFLCLMLIVGWNFIANDASKTSAQEKQRIFVGATTCTMCHNGMVADVGSTTSSADVWKNGPHAQAYAVLASEEAKTVAQEKGIENPQEADECLRCHVTGHGVEAQYLGKKYTVEEGVGCESCHGAGKDYANIKVKKSIKSGETDPASVGLRIPDEKTCLKCHNEESPTYKEFDFTERVKKIAHPVK